MQVVAVVPWGLCSQYNLPVIPNPNSPVPIEPASFAVPPLVHVCASFMLQFIAALGILGILPGELQSRGVGRAFSWAICAVALVLVYLLIGLLGRFLLVRCQQCSGGARYRGPGWWPFIYWNDCRN